MDLAGYLIAQWGIPGALVVAASLWAVRNQRTLETETAGAARAALERQAAHTAKLEELQKEHAAALQQAAQAAQAERERILTKLEAEHAARLTDAQANTRAMLELSEQVHATVNQLSDLAERLSQRPKS